MMNSYDLNNTVDKRIVDKDIYDALGNSKTIRSLVAFIIGECISEDLREIVLDQYFKALHHKQTLDVLALYVVCRVIRDHSFISELFERDLSFLQYACTGYKEPGFLLKADANIRFLSFLYNYYPEKQIVTWLKRRVQSPEEWGDTVKLFKFNMSPVCEYEFIKFYKPPRVLDLLTLQFEFLLCLHSIERNETGDHGLEYPQSMKESCGVWKEYEMILPHSICEIQDWMRTLYFDISGIMDEIIDHKAVFYGVKWKGKLLYMIYVDHFDGMVLQGVFGKYPSLKADKAIDEWYQYHEKNDRDIHFLIMR